MLLNKIENNYNKSEQNYYNLIHVAAVQAKLTIIKLDLLNREMVQFLVFYRDIIFDTIQNNHKV
jgi:predicted metal-dependent HD superfamily phosphohydrolase